MNARLPRKVRLCSDSEEFTFPDGLGGPTANYGLWQDIGERLGLPFALTEYEDVW